MGKKKRNVEEKKKKEKENMKEASTSSTISSGSSTLNLTSSIISSGSSTPNLTSSTTSSPQTSGSSTPNVDLYWSLLKMEPKSSLWLTTQLKLHFALVVGSSLIPTDLPSQPSIDSDSEYLSALFSQVEEFLSTGVVVEGSVLGNTISLLATNPGRAQYRLQNQIMRRDLLYVLKTYQPHIKMWLIVSKCNEVAGELKQHMRKKRKEIQKLRSNLRKRVSKKHALKKFEKTSFLQCPSLLKQCLAKKDRVKLTGPLEPLLKDLYGLLSSAAKLPYLPATSDFEVELILVMKYHFQFAGVVSVGPQVVKNQRLSFANILIVSSSSRAGRSSGSSSSSRAT